MSLDQIRDMNELAQAMRDRIEPWLQKARAFLKPLGYDALIVETYRTPERQAYLYSLGRSRPGKVVTYTLDSVHQLRCAVDWVPVKDGQAVWDAKLYERVYKAVPLAEYGLERLDFELPHLQVIGGQDAARKLGLSRDVRVTSVWPHPARTVVPVKVEANERVPLYRRDNTLIGEVSLVRNGEKIKAYLVGD